MLQSLRETFISQGLKPGEITHPDYMPAGEFRLEDPDRYVLLVEQLS